MIKMVTKQNIIHAYYQGHLSERAIAREYGVSRRTVRKFLAEYSSACQSSNENALEEFLTHPPRYDSSHRYARVLTPEVRAIIHECLQSNRRKKSLGIKRKQRMLKRDIWEYLQELGVSPLPAYSTVCQYIYKLEHTPAEREREAYIHQEYYAGEVCEFDWGETQLTINGKEERFYIAVFTLAFSNARWAYLFHHQDTLAFMESHRNFFRDVNGVPYMMVYDNMRVAVKEFTENGKVETEALRSMKLFYHYEHRFCNIRSGNEKGHVERSVEVVRRKAFCVKDSFADYNEAQSWLAKTCERLNGDCKAQDEEGNTIDLLERDMKSLQPKIGDIGCFLRMEREVDKWSTITFESNHYSVPDSFVGKHVVVKIYSERLTLWNGETKIASHDRSYAKGQWMLDINHYLKTFSRKPGAVKDSTALRRADSQLRELFDRHFTKDAKGFIELLVFAQENKHSHKDIVDAYNSLFERGFRKISVEQIRATLNHENISDDVYTMTRSGGAHALQIEQQSTETLEEVTRLFYPLNSKPYATDTQQLANY